MTTFLTILAAALCPAVVLFWYIYRKDSARPEPIRLLLMAFLYGMLSAPLALCFDYGLQLLGLPMQPTTTVAGSALAAFFGAALPEECAKLIMLLLLLRRNRNLDEYLDGIVYAACVGLGFASVENIMYLFDADDWVSVGITRGLLTVPGHFAFACAMGYYLSLWHFGGGSRWAVVKMLSVPIVLHWVWDASLFSMDASPGLMVVVVPLFVWYLVRLYRNTKRRIAHLKRVDDYIDWQRRQVPPPFHGV